MKTQIQDKATADTTALILENLLTHRRTIASWEIKHIQAEHAALVAVAEAAKQYAAVCNDWNLATLENALANLAAVREESGVAK